jgi:hypothetical protein
VGNPTLGTIAVRAGLLVPNPDQAREAESRNVLVLVEARQSG